MKIDGKEISKELMAKTLTCDSPEELVKLAKESGLELTTEQAKTFLEEMDEMDLTKEQLQQVAGGGTWGDAFEKFASCPEKHGY